MRALLLALSLIVSTHAAEPEKWLLWPQGAPMAKGTTDKDQPFVYVWPAAKGKATGAAFVVCPGGGYGGLAADHEGRQLAMFFNSIGVSAYVLHYRLGSAGYHYPVQLMDVQRAIRLVRSKAASQAVDPERVGIIGFSAGGHLTSMAATLFGESPAEMTHDEVDALSARPTVAAPTYPVISMSDDFGHLGSRKNLLGPKWQDIELSKKVSTHLQVTAKTPPCFIFQTNADTAVPAENAVQFYLALRRHHVPAEMHIFQDGPHGVGLMQGDPVLGSWPQQLAAWLRNQGFLFPGKRVGVKGSAKVKGSNISWGGVAFNGENAAAPRPTARIMHGKFQLDAAQGLAPGRYKATVTYSSVDVPGLETADGTAQGEATVDVVEGQDLAIDLKL
jgi:acetyl esterase/lipase